MLQSGGIYDPKISDLVKDIKEKEEFFPFYENLVEYLTSAKSEELQVIVDEIKGNNSSQYTTLLRRVSREKKETIEDVVGVFPNLASPAEIRCLTTDKVIQTIVKLYFNVRDLHLSTRKALSVKIMDVVFLLVAFDIGFIRMVFPGKKRFSGSTVAGANLAVNKIADSLLGAKIRPYLYLIPYCELIGPESKASELSEITREFLKLKTKEESIDFIQSHQEIHDCKYRQELQYQAYKAELKGERDYSAHCIHQMILLLFVSVVGKVYIKHVEILGNPVNFETEFKKNLMVIQERSKYLKRTFIDKFQFNFELPKVPHTFVVDIPKDSEDARFELFNDFPDQIKDALSSGVFVLIRKKFKELKIEDYKKYLVICAQQGFFYFAIDIDMKKFGPYREHIESLEIF